MSVEGDGNAWWQQHLMSLLRKMQRWIGKLHSFFYQASSSSYLGHQEERPAHTEGGFLLQLIHSGPIDSPRDVSLS